MTSISGGDSAASSRRVSTACSGSSYNTKSCPKCDLGVPSKQQAIELGATVRQLVAEDDLLLVRKGLRQTDEPLANQHFAAFGMLELLEVGVEGWRLILRQDAAANPRFEVGGGARVDVYPRRCRRASHGLSSGERNCWGWRRSTSAANPAGSWSYGCVTRLWIGPRLRGVAEGREGEDIRHRRL